MLHNANRLLAEGRSRGLRITMISQRPQKLHKDSLTQVETLVALRLTAPQDRDAVENWIGACADPKQGAEILSSLPSLPTGVGWIWAPEIGILERVQFPKIGTYDSSAAPNGTTGEIVLAKVDLPSIHARLESAAKSAAENDLKRLKARIAELEKMKGKPDPVALSDARLAGVAEGLSQGRADTEKAVREALAQAGAWLRALADDLALGVMDSGRTEPKPFDVVVDKTPPIIVGAPHKLTAPRPSSKSFAPADGVTGPQQRILDALAKLESLGVDRMKKGQVAAFADASPTSSAFANNLGRLRTMGLIEYPRGGEVGLTEAGVRAAAYPDAPPTVKDLQAAWLRLLSGPQVRILECLIAAHPDPLEKEGLAEQAGASVTSSAFANNLGALRSLGVLEYPERGFVAATDILFP